MHKCRYCGSTDISPSRVANRNYSCRKCESASARRRYHRDHQDSRRHEYHGAVGTPEYKAWAGMRERCFNPDHHGYLNYGARGISVCDRWNQSFKTFLADMGRRPSSQHSLDRIDVDGNYEPDNCRWATAKEQVENRRPRERWNNPRTGPVQIKVGDVFGRLEVMEDLGCPIKEHMFLCLCSCGNLHKVMRGSLIRGHTRSCGCLKQEWIKGPRGLRPGSRRYLQAQQASLSKEPIPEMTIPEKGETE